jgi:hypothetical protein
VSRSHGRPFRKGAYRDLYQHSMPGILDHTLGETRVLSGQAAEEAALMIVRQHLDPGATRFRQNLAGIAPDIRFSVGWTDVYLEIKSVAVQGDLLIRLDQHAGIERFFRSVAPIYYGFLIHPTGITNKVRPVDYIPFMLEHAELRVLDPGTVHQVLIDRGANYCSPSDTGWANYEWLRMSVPKFFHGLQYGVYRHGKET